MVSCHVPETIAHPYGSLEICLIEAWGPDGANQPLYRIVSKFSPIRLGKRNVFRWESHVPSPTCKVLDEYVLLPGGANSGEGDMVQALL